MPKKRPAPPKRKPKKPAQPTSPDDLRHMAAQLQSLAEALRDRAEAMEELGVETIEPLTGNFDLSLQKLKTFAARQVFAKIVAEAARQGRDAHALFGR